MSYNYTTYLDALRLAGVIQASNAAFVAYVPTIIDEAEQRCYRDLNLLSTIIADSSASTTASQRNFTLPSASGRFVVLESMNLLNGTVRTPLTKYSREVMDVLWPDSAASGGQLPVAYAPLTDQIYILGPSPGSTFQIECIGTIRPTPLSSTNTTTYLSLYLPDLFFSASMIALTAYQQNWGAQADNPKMGLSWDDDYAKRLPSAQTEETRRKYQAFASV
jgi:hypothetical protein